MVEIVCCSVDDCVAAQRGGADRIELCGGLEVGGMTPSLGVQIEVLARVDIPVVSMVRPRGGGFCYSEGEFASMIRDGELLLEHGASGLVFGCLTADGEINRVQAQRLVKLCGDRDVVHHRAFDVVPDPFEALEVLIDLGFTRLLTSGRKNTAIEGAPLLAALREKAAGRIEIMPAGHIRSENADEVRRLTGCTTLHLAPFVFEDEDSCMHNREISFSGVSSAPDGKRTLTDWEEVARVVAVDRSLAG